MEKYKNRRLQQKCYCLFAEVITSNEIKHDSPVNRVIHHFRFFPRNDIWNFSHWIALHSRTWVLDHQFSFLIKLWKSTHCVPRKGDYSSYSSKSWSYKTDRKHAQQTRIHLYFLLGNNSISVTLFSQKEKKTGGENKCIYLLQYLPLI